MITHTFTAVLYASPSQSMRGEIEGAGDLADAIAMASDVLEKSLPKECHRILLNVRIHKPRKTSNQST